MPMLLPRHRLRRPWSAPYPPNERPANRVLRTTASHSAADVRQRGPWPSPQHPQHPSVEAHHRLCARARAGPPLAGGAACCNVNSTSTNIGSIKAGSASIADDLPSQTDRTSSTTTTARHSSSPICSTSNTASEQGARLPSSTSKTDETATPHPAGAGLPQGRHGTANGVAVGAGLPARSYAARWGRSPEEQREVELRVGAWQRQQERLQEALEGRGPQLVVDCSFATGSSNRELSSLAKQLALSMVANRRAGAPLGLHFTAVGPELERWLLHIGGAGWPVHRCSEPTLQVFDLHRVVVLSPDAEVALEGLREDGVYCIGGLVDRSVRKNTTLGFAGQHRLPVRRLPVLEHAAQLGLAHGSCRRPVLNINSVVHALLAYHETGDWASSLDAAIPSRKRLPQNTTKPKATRGAEKGAQQQRRSTSAPGCVATAECG